MSAATLVCDNCGAEVSAEDCTRLEARTSTGGLVKTAVLCVRCLGYLPGSVVALGGDADANAGRDVKRELRSVESGRTATSRKLALPERHWRALGWFAGMAGRETGWPEPLEDGTLLACRPKGIYKPAWSKYALSVRESMSRPYPDEEPVRLPDGNWVYRYYQENLDPEGRDREFTNAGLLACQDDGVPVGVLRQVAARPQSRYEVLGVALVGEWRQGYFELVSAQIDGLGPT